MDERISVYEEKMTKAYEFLQSDYASIRAGRANPHILDKLRVDYYGTPTPIQQVGNITVPEARIIQIAPWEKSLIKAIEKAIMTSDIGITPSNDGSVIRLVFPELTEERRKDLVKEVKKKAEEAKVAVRNIRREGNDAFKKLGKEDVSEDEIKSLEEDLQKLTDKYIKICRCTHGRKVQRNHDCITEEGRSCDLPFGCIYDFQRKEYRDGRIKDTESCSHYSGRQRPMGQSQGNAPQATDMCRAPEPVEDDL